MFDSRNPARSRPLSANVKRLMKLAREAPHNPNVERSERVFTARDHAYCDMQGNIFMAAIDKGYDIGEFAPIFMRSQLAGVIDYSFSCANEMEDDKLIDLLQIPILLKSPDTIVDVVMWLHRIVGHLHEDDSASLAVLNACMGEEQGAEREPGTETVDPVADTEAAEELSEEELADQYEFAYWLGYIYRYESLLHEESSRMVYGAFPVKFMRRTYMQLSEILEQDGSTDRPIRENAACICRYLDEMLIGQLWKNV